MNDRCGFDGGRVVDRRSALGVARQGGAERQQDREQPGEPQSGKFLPGSGYAKRNRRMQAGCQGKSLKRTHRIWGLRESGIAKTAIEESHDPCMEHRLSQSDSTQEASPFPESS